MVCSLFNPSLGGGGGDPTLTHRRRNHRRQRSHHVSAGRTNSRQVRCRLTRPDRVVYSIHVDINFIFIPRLIVAVHRNSRHRVVIVVVRHKRLSMINSRFASVHRRTNTVMIITVYICILLYTVITHLMMIKIYLLKISIPACVLTLKPLYFKNNT